tara:strand:- start:421 stop:1098 length:678 start_codon:yes stop_codon:yes gene_type:complete
MERIANPPVPVAAAPPPAETSPADFKQWLEIITQAFAGIRGAGGMQTPAGAFAGKTAQTEQPPTPPPDPPPVTPEPTPQPAAETQTETPPEPEAAQDDPDHDPRPPLAEFQRAIVESQPENQRGALAEFIQSAQHAANEGNSPALAEIVFMFLGAAREMGQAESMRELVETDPGQLVDNLCAALEIRDSVQHEARTIVIEEMGPRMAELLGEPPPEQEQDGDSAG